MHSPDATGAALTIGLVLESRRTTLVDVGEAMARVQMECADLCALAPDRADRIVPVLERLNQRAMDLIDEPDGPFVDMSLAFHSALVELSGNQSLVLVAAALKLLWDSMPRVSTLPRRSRGSRRRDRISDVSTHEAVTSAIAKGDAPRVRHILQAHMIAALEFRWHIEGPSLIDVTSEGLEALREAAKLAERVLMRSSLRPRIPRLPFSCF